MDPVANKMETTIVAETITTIGDPRTNEEKETINQLSLKLLEQTELSTVLQQKIADLNKKLNHQNKLLIQARKEKHEADIEVSKLSQEVENITVELFGSANEKVDAANEEAYNTKLMNDRLSNTIKEKDITIDILKAELSNLKTIISEMENSATSTPNTVAETTSAVPTPRDDSKRLSFQQDYFSSASILTGNEVEEFDIPQPAYLNSKLLAPFNKVQIYTPLFNQIRFDLPPFITFSESLMGKSPPSTHSNELSHTTTRSISSLNSFNIRTTKFFLKLLDELDAELRLDKAPGLQSFKLRWNRKAFLIDIMDKIVSIEPLSASTEAWKRQTLNKYIPQSSVSTPSTPKLNQSKSSESYDPKLFKTAIDPSNPSKQLEAATPLAVGSACGLCNERRHDMNFSRLYRLKITSTDPNKLDSNKVDLPICINCANKYRIVVELLKFVGNLDPHGLLAEEDLDDYIKSSWIKLVQLKAKAWYACNVGIWSEKEKFGLVYGWQNDWLSSKSVNEVPAGKENTKSLENITETYMGESDVETILEKVEPAVVDENPIEGSSDINGEAYGETYDPCGKEEKENDSKGTADLDQTLNEKTHSPKHEVDPKHISEPEPEPEHEHEHESERENEHDAASGKDSDDFVTPDGSEGDAESIGSEQVNTHTETTGKVQEIDM